MHSPKTISRGYGFQGYKLAVKIHSAAISSPTGNSFELSLFQASSVPQHEGPLSTYQLLHKHRMWLDMLLLKIFYVPPVHMTPQR